jgi:hypothetical protein
MRPEPRPFRVDVQTVLSIRFLAIQNSTRKFYRLQAMCLSISFDGPDA